MTPLATELLEDITSGTIRIRGDNLRADAELVRQLVWSAKFFEVSAVTQVAMQLGQKMQVAFEEYDRVDKKLAFLPAEISWLEIEQPGFRDNPEYNEELKRHVNKFQVAKEWKSNYNYRTAFVFVGVKGSTHLARRYCISYETPRLHEFRIWRVSRYDDLPLVQSNLKPQRHMQHTNNSGDTITYEKAVSSSKDFVHYALLALINSPRVIGRHQHMPHERIEREKLKKLGLVGKFPLHAWTEILLKVAVNPEDKSDDPTQEAHLTGEKCLHYCRTHIRIRLGQLEYVEGHWRGNPALGIKRSRYRVEPESTNQ